MHNYLQHTKVIFQNEVLLPFPLLQLRQKIPYAFCTLHIFDDGLELLQNTGSTGNIEISSYTPYGVTQTHW